MADTEKLSRGLGIFSIGLGLFEMMAPRTLARIIGVRDHRVLPKLGAREIANGFALLAQPRKSQWAWARVGGDAMDLSLLSQELGPDNPERQRVVATTFVIAAITALDALSARQIADEFPQSQRLPAKPAEDAWMAVTIDRPAEDLYRFWHNFENLPRIMPHLEEVRVDEGGRSYWRTKAPVGGSVSWQAQIVEDRPNELIRWQSVAGSDIHTSGTITFKPAVGGRGTIVRAQIKYDLPGGMLTKLASKVSSESPERQVYDALRAFKQVMEVGEVIRSDGTLAHRGPGQRPAQPLPAAKAA